MRQKVLEAEDNLCGHTEIPVKILNIDLGKMEIDGFDCPAKAGPVTITQGGELASFMPVKTTSVRITTQANDGKQIQCVDMRQDVGSGADAALFHVLFEQLRNEEDDGVKDLPQAAEHRARFLEHLRVEESGRELESSTELEAVLRRAYAATRDEANEVAV